MTDKLFELEKPEITVDEQIAISEGQVCELGTARVQLGDAASFYNSWPAPTVIVSDGPYGLNSFPGDPLTHEGLADFYDPHAKAWAEHSLPETTLWFWCSEVGWATAHPTLERHGWEYRSLHIWNKGVGHIAGNVNSKTIRGFPVVTEVCARYTRKVELPDFAGEKVTLREWLRSEWIRSGLPLYKTNEACEVKNAATRKYFTQDHLWYFPPPKMMEKLSRYANEYGNPEGKPYLSIDGKSPTSAIQWSKMRAKWNHTHGITNVWSEPAMRGRERIKSIGAKSMHMNQKPLRIMERIVTASSDASDVVWEPFGGLCSTSAAAMRSGRHAHAAEINSEFYNLATARLEQERIISKELEYIVR